MNNRKAIVLNDKSVKTIGRTYLYNDTLWAAFSGAGAEFIFTGKKLEITVTGDFASTAGNDENYARIAIYVDNERVVDDMLDEKEKTYKVLESESAECRNVRVIKLSECAMSTFGIKPVMIAENEKIEPAPAKNIKMEFIGDSITCGYGVDDPDKEHHFKTATEDVTKAYAYKTALALNADYSMVSVSGYGIISGFTNDGNKIPEQTIPQYYDKLGFSYNKFADSITVSETEWDFERYKPDIIVINLGTNDMNYATTDERKAEFEDGYLDFLKKVRSLNPDSYIFQTYGVMGTSLEENIENVRRKYMSETGDERITFIPLTMQDEDADGIVADWHPSPRTHSLVSQKVTAAIKKNSRLQITVRLSLTALAYPHYLNVCGCQNRQFSKMT